MEKLYDAIVSLTTINAFVFGLLFILKSRLGAPRQFLGLFLITNVGVNLVWIFNDFRLLPLNFLFLIVPVFYLYVKKVLGVFHKRAWLHLLPGVLEFCFTSTIILLNKGKSDIFFEPKYEDLKMLVFFILPPCYNVIYLIFTYIELRKYKVLISNVYTDVERIRLFWLVATCSILIVNYLIEFVSSFILVSTNLDNYLFLFHSLCACFITYWTTIYGLNQKDLLLEKAQEIQAAYTDNHHFSQIQNETVDTVERSSKNNPPSEKYLTIVNFFLDTKLYRNKDVNLFMVSELLQMSYKEVSRLINHHAQKNFNQFVNEFRIEEAKRLLQQDEYKKYTITYVGDLVGFNSKATFFSAFKNIVGKTPLEYQNEAQLTNTNTDLPV